MEINKPKKTVILIPTHEPDDTDPRDFSTNARLRFLTGASRARTLREEHDRASVFVVVFGGWALHERLPLAVHHVYAAIRKHEIFKPIELDVITANGVNTETDLNPTMPLLRDLFGDEFAIEVIASEEHGKRLIAGCDLHRYSNDISVVDSGETIAASTRTGWLDRARETPAYQYKAGGRLSDVLRGGIVAAHVWEQKMEAWAKCHTKDYEDYRTNIWDLIRELQHKNVIIVSDSPGCMRLKINI